MNALNTSEPVPGVVSGVVCGAVRLGGGQGLAGTHGRWLS